MNRSMEHLPKIKQEEVNQLACVIRKMCDDVEMIILFGSYARGDWKEESDLEPDRQSGHKSDYDILVVTKDKNTAHDANIWHEITHACNDLKQSTYARIISHDIEHLNIQLAEGQYFFSDIKREGRMLYDSGKCELAEKRGLTPDEKKRIAQDHFDYWFGSANSFFRRYKNAFEEEDYINAAFQLHQATEASYKTVLLVFTNYNPNEHYLNILSEMACGEDERFTNIFPNTTVEDQERFEKLDHAYIGARYIPEFRISRTDLKILERSVDKLLELTEKICAKRIQSLVFAK